MVAAVVAVARAVDEGKEVIYKIAVDTNHAAVAVVVVVAADDDDALLILHSQ